MLKYRTSVVVHWSNILPSTKNASLIITDFLAMVYKNEHPRTASLCRGCAMLKNDFNMICRWRVISMTSYRLNLHMTALCTNRLWFQFEFVPSLWHWCFAKQWTHFGSFFFQTVVLASNNLMKLWRHIKDETCQHSRHALSNGKKYKGVH